MMSIFTLLPGLRDQDAVARAHGMVRASGLLGIAVVMICYIAAKMDAPASAVALPLFLSLCWSISMLGLTFLLDARRGWMYGGTKGFFLHLVIAFSVTGVGMFACGTSAAIFACVSIITS